MLWALLDALRGTISLNSRDSKQSELHQGSCGGPLAFSAHSRNSISARQCPCTRYYESTNILPCTTCSVFSWPACSPDMLPIKRVRDYIGQRLSRTTNSGTNYDWTLASDRGYLKLYSPERHLEPPWFHATTCTGSHHCTWRLHKLLNLDIIFVSLPCNFYRLFLLLKY